MKIYALIALLISGCTAPNKEMCNWISSHKKPIVCFKTFSGYEPRYMLISADGKAYLTGVLAVNLPDTIK